ncbi:MAG: helix-turn-helix transcriptional regulator [Anaerotignum sp.]|nr:helix-turn-helix transcriptional regulator [Anaerotignum sp.]
MRKRCRELWNLLREIKEGTVGLHRKMILFLLCMLLCVFAAIMVIFSIAGVFSDSEEELYQVLSRENQNTVTALTEQIEAMEARSIAFAEQVNAAVDDVLYTDSISTLNDQSGQLLSLQRTLYDSVNVAVGGSPCSGAYVILDATTNTSSPIAKDSRTGMYLRFANLSVKNSVKQDIVYFRGIPKVARERQLEMHNRWNLEFDVSRFYGYYELFQGDTSGDSYWTGRMPLADTWEDVILLVVPIKSSTGELRGVCGMELSDLYFRLSYPAYQSEYGSIVTIVAPVRDGRLMMKEGMHGALDSTYLTDAEVLKIKEGRYFNKYIGESGTYLGVQQEVDMLTAKGEKMVAVSLVPNGGYVSATNANRINWIVGSLVFLLTVAALVIWMSGRFVRPIEESLAAIRDEENLEGRRSGISEIDALLDFVREKLQNQSFSEEMLPPDVAELFDTFSENAKMLTPMERRILQYYIDGHEVAEVSELAFISIHTVRKHNANIYQKLDVNSRDELMLYIDLFRRCGRLQELTEER